MGFYNKGYGHTSINLPRIAIKAKGDMNWFFEEPDRKINLVIDHLLAL